MAFLAALLALIGFGYVMMLAASPAVAERVRAKEAAAEAKRAAEEEARKKREAKLDELHEKLTGAVERLVTGEDWADGGDV